MKTLMMTSHSKEDMIYENNNYKVVVGSGIDYEVDHYLVINKNTGVVEVETRLYPQAILYSNQLDEGLSEVGDAGPKLAFNH